MRYIVCRNHFAKPCYYNILPDNIVEFPDLLVSTQSVSEGNVRCVEGLTEVLSACYERAILPSELGTSWAQKGNAIDLHNYHKYPK
jgi:hypothetical protein